MAAGAASITLRNDETRVRRESIVGWAKSPAAANDLSHCLARLCPRGQTGLIGQRGKGAGQSVPTAVALSDAPLPYPTARFQPTGIRLTVRLHELFEPERSIGGTELCCPAIPVFRLGRVGLEIDDA